MPLSKTLKILEKVEGSTLPNTKLYIMANNRPTKNNVVRQSMVDIQQVKAAVAKLKVTFTATEHD